MFCEMLFSRLNFSSKLTSCGHWWLVWGKLNATRHLVFWRFSVDETLVEQLHETWDVHSCLFHIITSGKEEAMTTFTHAPRCRLNWRVYTAICHATLKSVKTKDENLFLSKVTIYKIGNFQWSSTHAVHTCLWYWTFLVWICVPLHPLYTVYIYIYIYILFFFLCF